MRSAFVLAILLAVAYSSVYFLTPDYAPYVDSPAKQTVSGNVLISANVSISDWNSGRVTCHYTPEGGIEQDIGEATCDSSGTYRICNCTWNTSSFSQGNYEITVKAWLWDPILGLQLESQNSTWVFVGAETSVSFISPSYAPSVDSPSKENVSDVVDIIVNVTSSDWDITSVTCFFSGTDSGFIGFANCSGDGSSRLCSCRWDMGLESLPDGDYEIKVNTTSSFNTTWVYADNPVYIVFNQPGEGWKGWFNRTAIDVSWGISGSIPADFANVTTDCDSDGVPEHVATDTNDVPYTCVYTSEGLYNITLKSSDTKGHTKEYTSSIGIDLTPPSASFSGSPGVYTHGINVSISASDGLSGVSKIYYAVVSSSSPCSSFASFSGSRVNITLDSEGSWKVCYRSEDNAGNLEDVKEAGPFVIDINPPSISYSSSSPSGVWSDSVIVNFTVSDNVTGVDYEAYAIASASSSCSDFKPVFGNFSVLLSKEGLWKVCVIARDGAGNERLVETPVYYVDTSFPEIWINITNNSWFNQSEISFNYSLQDISFSEGYFEIFNSSWRKTEMKSPGYSLSSFNLSDGCYWVKLNSSDSLGRYSELAYRFCVDTILPELNFTGLGENTTLGYYTSRVLHAYFNASDLNFKEVEVQVNGEKVNSTENMNGSIAFSVPEGNVTVCLIARDMINSVKKCENISVSYTPPYIRDVWPSGYVTSPTADVDVSFRAGSVALGYVNCRIEFNDDSAYIRSLGKSSIKFEGEYGNNTLRICCTDLLNRTSCYSGFFFLKSPRKSIFINPFLNRTSRVYGRVPAVYYGLNLYYGTGCAGKSFELKASRNADIFIYYPNRSLMRVFRNTSRAELVFPNPGSYYVYAAAHPGVYKGWIVVEECGNSPGSEQRATKIGDVEPVNTTGNPVKGENTDIVSHTQVNKEENGTGVETGSNIELSPLIAFINFLVNKIRELLSFL